MARRRKRGLSPCDEEIYKEYLIDPEGFQSLNERFLPEIIDIISEITRVPKDKIKISDGR